MTFDASGLLNQAVEGPMATYVAPPPEGEFLARVDDGEDAVKLDQFDGKKDPSKKYTRVTLIWDIIDENLKAAMERDKITVRDQFFLDLDPITGQLKVGKEDNVALGQRREALGLNGSGSFSLANLRGAGPCMVKISHRADDRDPQRKYAEIARCVKLG